MKRSLLTMAAACLMLQATATNNSTPVAELQQTASTPATLAAPADAKAHVQQLTKHYLTMKDALVASKAKEASTAAASLLKALEGFDAKTLAADVQATYKAEAEGLKTAVSSISKSSDIEQQRKALGPLTQHLYALNKAFAAGEGSLYYQHCPMANNNKGGSWLSAEKEVLNPYFGDKMLKCGRVKETL